MALFIKKVHRLLNLIKWFMSRVLYVLNLANMENKQTMCINSLLNGDLMKTDFLKLLLATCCATTLAACGGGGGK
ncbi:MAG: hypothetical protein ACJAUP_001639 [Cellvibrionaceae bacterium]|jgi:hypothetical protein